MKYVELKNTSHEGEDCSAWLPSQDGVFSVLSFFLVASSDQHTNSFLFNLWKIKAPSRVITFAWLAILAMDNHRRRKWIEVNACPMFLADEEMVDHLMLSCKAVQAMWRSVLGWFDCKWVLPRKSVSLLRLGTCTRAQ